MPKVYNKAKGPVPEGAVDITRQGGKWGNPFIIGVHGNRYEVIAKHKAMLATRPDLVEEVKRELRGKDLMCVCVQLKCHGDTLLEIANE
jgi:hypothetical protein